MKIDLNQKTSSILTFLVSFLWLMASSLITIIPFLIIGVLQTNDSLTNYMETSRFLYLDSFLASILSTIIFIIITFILFKEHLIADFKNFKNNIIKYGIIIIGGFILIIGTGYLFTLIYDAFDINYTSVNQQTIETALSSKYKGVVITYCVIFAPIIEEFIFRKFLFAAIKSFKLPTYANVIICSSVFALIHVADIESLKFFFEYFTLSLILTTTYVLTKENLPSSIFLHFLNNLWACF